MSFQFTLTTSLWPGTPLTLLLFRFVFVFVSVNSTTQFSQLPGAGPCKIILRQLSQLDTHLESPVEEETPAEELLRSVWFTDLTCVCSVFLIANWWRKAQPTVGVAITWSEGLDHTRTLAEHEPWSKSVPIAPPWSMLHFPREPWFSG